MKLLLSIFLFLSLSSTFYTTMAQSVAEWQLPSVEIPLVRDGKAVAILKARLISKSATFNYGDEVFTLKLKKDQNVCVITLGSTEHVVATISKLGRKSIEVASTEGNSFTIERTGKKKNRQYLKAGAPFLLLNENTVITGNQQLNTLELLAQAALVFRLVYKQYDSEKSSSVVYYPVVTSIAVPN